MHTAKQAHTVCGLCSLPVILINNLFTPLMLNYLLHRCKLFTPQMLSCSHHKCKLLTPDCTSTLLLLTICFTASATLKTGCHPHPASQLNRFLLSSTSSSSSPLAIVLGEGGGKEGGAWTEAEPPRLRNQMLRGYPPPRRIVFRLTEWTRRHTWENRIHQ